MTLLPPKYEFELWYTPIREALQSTARATGEDPVCCVLSPAMIEPLMNFLSDHAWRANAEDREAVQLLFDIVSGISLDLNDTP